MSLEALRALLVAHFRGEAVASAALAKAAKSAEKGLDEEGKQKFAEWSRAVRHFEQLEDDARAVVVARGLRLCRLLAGAPKVASARRVDQPKALAMPTHSLPGIGPKAADALSERGIDCVEDLIYFVPRRYDDARSAVSLADVDNASVGERVTIRADVESRALVRRGRRRWLDVRFKESGVRLIVRFFGAYPSALDRYEVGTTVVMAGALSERAGSFEMSNPDVLAVGEIEGAGEAPQILARYRAVPGVAAKRLANACLVATERAAGKLVSAVPAWVEEEAGLSGLRESIERLHSPPADDGIVTELNSATTPWHRRLAFEEMFVLAGQIGRRRNQRKSGDAFVCSAESDLVGRAREALPFVLTGAQERVVGEIASDLGESAPMNRLLQGDVGCGKTAVAFLAAAAAIAAGGQVALMAPTEILAEQHASSLKAFADKVGIRLALLTGSIPTAQKRSLLALLAAGKIDLVVGTHSLIAQSVAFKELALAIVDEQHRFGVAQRVELRRKGAAPHLLVMTATPIPRSLALSVYGDLDVSVIDELPPGRVPTKTHVMTGDEGRLATYRALARRVERGEQAFVVCPLVEPPEADSGREWRSAIGVHRELSGGLEGTSVGLVHGRLSVDERAEAMDRFRRGLDSILVATTVIEVGVDVPSATVIVVEDADHFGLAQLHQLRGRVGRGELPGECALLCRGRLTEDGRRRLEVMAETTDGFRIAEEDLAIRGPGELLGSRQAGLPPMRFGDLRKHLELLTLARQFAARVFDRDPKLEAPEHQALRAVLERTATTEAYDGEGG